MSKHKASDDLLLSTATKTVPDDPSVRKASLDVIQRLDTASLSNYAGAVVDAVEKNARSLRPDINEKLASVHAGKVKDLFECGIRERLEKTAASAPLKIPVGNTVTKGKPKCVDATSKIARDRMFKNYRGEGKLDPHSIIAPMQFHTNCWFNTMFMCLFVSDKGRQFMRFFRELMIKGKTVEGKQITPTKLNEALVLLNLAIEACYNHRRSAKNIGLALNTNNIIHSIYDSIPDSYKSKHNGIRDVDQYGNPYTFYRDLIEYLTDTPNESAKMVTVKETDNVAAFYAGSLNENADVIAVQVTDSGAAGRATPKDAGSMPTTVSLPGATYTLDSFVARDIAKMHYCCGIKINGKEYVFDGAAFSPLTKRRWTPKLGENANWSVKGSKNIWNFSKGYSLLFYYKTA